ncbi:putative ATP-dependent RNA helicase Dbp73D [Trichinella spiralis]|uniref:putative ATP-dependent RNA helicase Dbp73D n=1 Tax=Trichinella spiralis TaxID=6334 RepID=UPI0001EFCED0|nr:putative ATP-dependent RNA helicase Dbp73D [Trichinella spiralis]
MDEKLAENLDQQLEEASPSKDTVSLEQMPSNQRIIGGDDETTNKTKLTLPIHNSSDSDKIVDEYFCNDFSRISEVEDNRSCACNLSFASIFTMHVRALLPAYSRTACLSTLNLKILKHIHLSSALKAAASRIFKQMR